MPPLEASLRGSLLTGASALALSISAFSARAQGVIPPQQPTWLVWIEGGSLYTSGGNYNVPSLPNLGSPFFSFAPSRGVEGAAGFEYHAPAQPWHFVFDIQGGITSWATKNNTSHGTYASVVPGYTDHRFFHSTNSAETARERENHAAMDFMIGRDFGLGLLGIGQLQFGARIADLSATANGFQTESKFHFNANGVLLPSSLPSCGVGHGKRDR